MACLAIPDSGGAISSHNGRADSGSYRKWFDKYVAPKYRSIGNHHLTGEECYFLRCSLLHRGSMQTQTWKIIFCEFPQTDGFVHPIFLTQDGIIVIEPKTFCNRMVIAAYDWLEESYNDTNFKKNSINFMTLFSISFPGISK